ncbi:DUF3592 domain-containing protein [Ottowia sp.]|jgi:hypothetical protein|uniref:DUF3592 domain-containing protein n=1 Tax=Ottowia sp. TaxID=1898956 RepID=UPI002D1FB5F9|nr:DUF3592 domain-containing protein [Ottowia sp.]
MVYVVSLFALGCAAMSLFLLARGVSALLRSWRATRYWLRVQGRVIDVEARRGVTTTPSRVTSANSSRGYSGQGLREEIVYIPKYQYTKSDGSTATVVSGAVSSDPETYKIGRIDELLVDPEGVADPLTNVRSGIWFMPLGMLAASVCAAVAALAAGYMVVRNLGLLSVE